MIRDVLYSFLTVLYPKRCKLCGEVIGVREEYCEECENTKMLCGELCHKCGREKSRCTCKKEKYSPKYKAFTAPYYYKGSMERGIIRFKNHNFTELKSEMSKRIASAVKSNFGDVKFDCVCAVPMTEKKMRKRGYNQSELLAKELAPLLDSGFEALLVKTIDTDSQRFSSASKRRVNLYGSIELAAGESVENKTVLLVDDVKTTGSTLNECAAVLRGHRAEAVYAAAFTVTDKRK